MTAVELIKVQRHTITIGSHDLLDGTPILDIKPYIGAVDAFPESRIGWLAEIEASEKVPPQYSVTYGEKADEQLEWLLTQGIDLRPRMLSILERDPSPHRTRRIRPTPQGQLRMGCGAWRVYFTVTDFEVTVHRFAPGYPARALRDLTYTDIPHQKAQIDFSLQFGGEAGEAED